MKHIIGLAVLTVVAMLFRFCGNKSAGDKTTPVDTLKSDTSYVFGFYVPPENNNVRYDLLLRITRPDSGMVSLGNGLFKKGLVKDSLYGFPMLDTVRDRNRVPLRDSIGKIKVQFQYMFVPKQKVWDLGILSDSVMKRFSGVLVRPDTANKK